MTEAPSLRERNRRQTHAAIVEAAGQVLRETGEADFSMPAVAVQSGVSLRTVYRYFPTRQDLIAELAELVDQAQAGPLPTLDELPTWLANAWRNLLAEEALIRAQHSGEAGIEIRRARIPLHRAVTEQLLAAERPDLTAVDRADLVEIALLVTSSTALFEFVDVLQVDVDRAAELAASVVVTMVRTR